MAMGGLLLGDEGGGKGVEEAEGEEVHSGVAAIAEAGEGPLRQPSAAVEETRRGGGQASGRQRDPLRLSRVSCCTCRRAAGLDAASASRNMVAASSRPVASDVGREPGGRQGQRAAGATQRTMKLVED